MRQNRSADPWSTFLAPTDREGAARSQAARESGMPPSFLPHPAGPDPADACRKVLDQLASAHGPQTFDQIRYGTGLGLLEIAEAVELLRDRGLVSVESGTEEAVRLTAGGSAG
ncbi:winged helix DNA-binding domain-containing protein [Actinomadura macrotermitis]|uniref:FtsK gamma domain-containing protein n=1 Tax=Actinomadura macrotermitis TaxID=2585200 RepID=A0A7K0BN12_9ACTN|nr:hypothetical protein [Actinomadura macrotermitis]MQY02569.1 hypothetical protein [Actinomadura macrotermitis]